MRVWTTFLSIARKKIINDLRNRSHANVENICLRHIWVFLNNEWSNKIIDMKKKCAWLWLHFKFIAFLAVNSNNSRLTGLIVCPFYTLNLNDFSFLWAFFDSALYFSKHFPKQGFHNGVRLMGAITYAYSSPLYQI